MGSGWSPRLQRTVVTPRWGHYHRGFDVRDPTSHRGFDIRDPASSAIRTAQGLEDLTELSVDVCKVSSLCCVSSTIYWEKKNALIRITLESVRNPTQEAEEKRGGRSSEDSKEQRIEYVMLKFLVYRCNH